MYAISIEVKLYKHILTETWVWQDNRIDLLQFSGLGYKKYSWVKKKDSHKSFLKIVWRKRIYLLTLNEFEIFTKKM